MTKDILELLLILGITIIICISITINHSKDIEYEKYKIEKQQINILED